MQLSKYSLERLREDGKFILYRAHGKQIKPPSVLLLAQASTGSNPKTLTRIEHKYPLRSELDSACAARRLALSERSAQMTVILEDPGVETLDGFISGPMELARFWRFGVTLATVLGALDQRRRIHSRSQLPIRFERVHGHIAKHPVALHEHAKSLPACVSVIAMKLLAKTSAERHATRLRLPWRMIFGAPSLNGTLTGASRVSPRANPRLVC